MAHPEWVYHKQDRAWVCIHQDREIAAYEEGQLPPYKLSYGPAFSQARWFETDQEMLDWVGQEADSLGQTTP